MRLCVEPPAKVFVSRHGKGSAQVVLFTSLMRAKMTGPESSGWSQPLQAANACCRIAAELKSPLHTTGVGFPEQLVDPIEPLSSSHFKENWSMPFESGSARSRQYVP